MRDDVYTQLAAILARSETAPERTPAQQLADIATVRRLVLPQISGPVAADLAARLDELEDILHRLQNLHGKEVTR